MTIENEIKELKEEYKEIFEVSDKIAQGALDAAQQRYNRKGYEASMKLFQGDSKGAIEDGNKAQDEYNRHINAQLRRAKRLGKKLVQDKNDHDSFKIEDLTSESLEKIKEEVSSLREEYKEIFERNSENKAKKEKWENKINKITKKEKAYIQGKAKEHADQAKEERKIAADYDHIASIKPAGSARVFDEKARHFQRRADWEEGMKKEWTDDLTKKLKNRKHSFHDFVRGYTDEALKESIKELKEEYKEIFEASKKGEEKEVNKIKYEKDNGPDKEPTEVVSVADELFPYKGTAKEQYNQKIIAKINDMIEGTATLDDLINLVRKKKAVKVAENLEETMDKILAVTEEIVSELDYNFVSKQKASADKTLAKKEKEAEEKEGKEKEEALNDVAKYKHKMNSTMDHVNQKRMKEIKAEEAKKNNK